MKALLVTHPEADFLEGVVYMGMHELLGDGIVDFPYKRSYHGEVDTYPSRYTHGDRTGTTGPFSWLPNLPARVWHRDEVVQGLRDRAFEFVFFPPRPYALRELRTLIGDVGRGNMPPLVLLDGEDYDYLEVGMIEEFRPKVYLKRENLGASHPLTRVEPFPFASPVPVHEPVAKDIDILFLGGGTSPARQQGVDALMNAFGSRFVGGVGGGASYRDYLSHIARARVAISIRGWGLDTLRFWEIPSFDTLLVADRIPLVKPYPFEHGRDCLYFDDVGGLVDGVRCALEDVAWREGIARTGNAHLRQWHTARARAQQLVMHATRG